MQTSSQQFDNVVDVDFTPASTKVPPQNIEAEEEILGGILIDPEAMERVVSILDPDAFYVSSHQVIYQALLALYQANLPTDLRFVTDWLSGHGLLEKAGGKPKLFRLGETPYAVNIDALAALVQEKFTRRQLLAASTKLQQLAHDGSKNLDQVLDDAQQMVYNLAARGKVDPNEVESISSVIPRVWDQLENGKKIGITTKGKFLDLEKMTGGFYPRTLTIAAARTGIGKTQLAIALTYEIAKQGLPVVFFSCEMSKEEVTNRLLARHTRIDSSLMREGKLLDADWVKLAGVLNEITAMPVYIHSASRPDPTQMRTTVRQVAAAHSDKIGLIVLDYIQLLGAGTDNRANELDKVVRDFRALGQDFNAPCLGLAQINRGVESRNDKRPLLSDIRESGAIENHADVVLLLYREDYYQPDTPDKDIIEINVAKNRHGTSGVVRMLFKPQFSEFRNVARRGE